MLISNLLILAFGALLPVVTADAGPTCYFFPGAVTKDCLQMVRYNLDDDTEATCGRNGYAAISYGQCTTVTACGAGKPVLTNDDLARRGLSILGECIISAYGSIAGYYQGPADTPRTCLLYPGSESAC